MSERKFTAGVRGKPVSVNRMYGRRARGGFYLTDAAGAWETAIITDVRAQLDTDAVGAAWRAADFPQLAVSITFYGVRGDIDNYLKCTLDGLKRAVGIDDRFFSPVEAHLGERKRANGLWQPPGARIEITVPEVPLRAPELSAQGPTTPAEPAMLTPGGLRVRDLVDPALLARLLPPVTRVRVWPATDYGAIVVMFPPSQIAQHDTEWGTFLPLSQARQLRDALNRLPALGGSPSATDTTDGSEATDATEATDAVEVSR